MQTAVKTDTMSSVISRTYSNEGLLAFYKGIGPPLITLPLVNSIVFASYEFSKSRMGVEPDQQFTVKQNMVAGCFAGFVNSFVVAPIELVKCRLQIQTEKNPQDRYYRSTIHAVTRIVQEEGVAALNKGMVATILREVPCYAA